jgi:hypothetical protein
MDSIKAIDLVNKVLSDLDIETNEIQSIQIDEVMGIGTTPQSKEPTDLFVKELLVTVQRGQNDINIFNSLTRLAINNDGKISRLLVRWPNFNLKEGLTLKDREWIIKEIISQIEKQEKGNPVALEMILAYTLTEAEEETYYVPALVVTVKDDKSARIFTVNIAK